MLVLGPLAMEGTMSEHPASPSLPSQGSATLLAESRSAGGLPLALLLPPPPQEMLHRGTPQGQRVKVRLWPRAQHFWPSFTCRSQLGRLSGSWGGEGVVGGE